MGQKVLCAVFLVERLRGTKCVREGFDEKGLVWSDGSLAGA